LGNGKGYYDYYLKDKNIYTVGVCFKEQLCDELPVEENDKVMAKIITD